MEGEGATAVVPLGDDGSNGTVGYNGTMAASECSGGDCGGGDKGGGGGGGGGEAEDVFW